MLGKLFTEEMELMDEVPVEACQAVGANGIQTMFYARIPQLLPIYASLVLNHFEIGVRSASTLGLVGAGGIGAGDSLGLDLETLWDESVFASASKQIDELKQKIKDYVAGKYFIVGTFHTVQGLSSDGDDCLEVCRSAQFTGRHSGVSLNYEKLALCNIFCPAVNKLFHTVCNVHCACKLLFNVTTHGFRRFSASFVYKDSLAYLVCFLLKSLSITPKGFMFASSKFAIAASRASGLFSIKKTSRFCLINSVNAS